MNDLATTKAKPGEIMKKVECYSRNIAEMSSEMRQVLIDPKTDELKDIQLKEAIQAIQVAYDQTRETVLECTGETFEIKLPNNFSGQAIQTVLLMLGLRLDNVVVTDNV